jgi:hypothetical protein
MECAVARRVVGSHPQQVVDQLRGGGEVVGHVADATECRGSIPVAVEPPLTRRGRPL